jgi:DNA-binding transcriptional MerR regulator
MEIISRKEAALVLVQKQDQKSLISLEEVARRCELHPDLVDQFRALGLIDPIHEAAEGGWLFSPDILMRIRKIIRLRRDLGLNLLAVGVVLDLLERIEVLEARIRELERTK